MVVDRPHKTAAAKLEEVRDGAARCTIEATLPLTRPPDGVDGGWEGTGAITFDTRMTVPLEGRLRLESDIEGRVVLGGDVRTADGTTRLDMQLQDSRKTTVGGEFPEPAP
jgi:hypothetical protein